ncbi:MAG: hypothetical protein VX278_23870 [Myxococcota bacterium]|nr:hypothetical protein [Myxococcota bacterium]
MNKITISQPELEAVDEVLEFIIRFGLTVPAILTLETLRPLSRMGAQFMHILTPSICVFLSPSHWTSFAELLEQPGGLDHILSRLEFLDRKAQIQ